MHKLTDDKRIRVITGHYGSGKTEFSVNYALRLAEEVQPVYLADLDAINTYFRSREGKEFLIKGNVELISSSSNADGLDVPAINAQVMGPIKDNKSNIILDVGGNPQGSRVMGQFKDYVLASEYDHFFVINRNRPETADADGAISLLRQTENVSGIDVTGLVNSTHMLKSTSVKDVLYGQELLEEVSERTGLPIIYISVIESVIKDLPEDLKKMAFPINLKMRQDWMS